MDTVLVTGATGQQGGATLRALRARGVPVRALVRDPDTDRARALAPDAELVTGDLLDPGDVARAVRGVRAVFSVQMPPVRDGRFDHADELAQAVHLIEAARAEGVEQFVQTTVSGADQYGQVPGWPSMAPYYETKQAVQERVRAAGFRFWTLLKPGTFMENFLPSAAFLFPRGVAGGLVTVLRPGTRVSLVAVADIGTAAATALTEPERFHTVELELAGDHLTMTAIARTLADTLGEDLTAPDLSPEEALAAGMPAYAAVSFDRMNAVGQPARPEFARALGLPLTSFAEWAAGQEQLRPRAGRTPAAGEAAGSAVSDPPANA